MSAKYKSPSFLLPNEINTNTNPLNTDSDPATGTGVNSLYSMDFDGTEYINAGQTLNIYGSQPRTISCWFNINSFATTSSGDGSNLLGYGTGTPLQAFSIAVTKYPNNPNHRIFLHVWNAAQDISGTTQILENNWYLATVTYDGSTLKLYLNGNLEGSSSTSSLNTATYESGWSTQGDGATRALILEFFKDNLL